MIIRNLVNLCICIVLFAQTVHAQLTYEQLFVNYDSVWTYKNLQLIPIYFKGPGGAKAEILSIQQAMKMRKVRIREVNYAEGSDKNVLKITNRGKKKIMLNSGEILAGGKQDRVVAETKIIAPGTTEYINVYCIEKGRWDDKEKEFNYQGAVDPSLKKVMDMAGRQHDIWKEIDRQFNAQGKASKTWSYLELYKTPIKGDSNYVNYFMDRFHKSDSSFAGFIAITGKEVIQTELFASVNMTNLAFGGMLNTLVNRVVESGSTPSVPTERIKPIMDRLLQDETSQKAFVAAHGKMHQFQGEVIHIVVYDLF
jgi:hypothetical protein